MKRFLFALSTLLLTTPAFAQHQILKDETTAQLRRVPILMVDATDGETEETGLTPTCTVSEPSDSGFDASSNSPTEIANGHYYLELATTEVDSAGVLRYRCTDAAAKTFHGDVQIVETADGTAQAGAATTITLATTASSTDDTYNNVMRVAIVGGTGEGQSRCIKDYVGSTRVATVDTWTTNPDNTSEYVLLAGCEIGKLNSNALANFFDTDSGQTYAEAVAGSPAFEIVNNVAVSAGGGGAVSLASDGDNTGGAVKSVTFVGSQTGTFSNVEQLDGTLHTIDDTGNAIDIVYTFAVGGGRDGVTVLFDGYVTGSNDQIEVFAYDFVGTDWDQIGTISGQSGSSNVALSFELLAKHTGTGSDLGEVYIRFEETAQSNPQLNIDRLWVSAVNVGQTIGYALGAIWVDTNNGTAGTESFINGTADNPVDTWADALTISGNVGINRFVFAANSSITLTGSIANYELMGQQWDLNLGSQNISGAFIEGASILASTATGTSPIFERCIFDANVTLPPGVIRRSFFGDITITAGSAGNFFLNSNVSRVAGTAAPNFDFGAAVGASGMNLRDYSGGIEIENMGTGDTASIEGNGAITINANSSDGTMAIRGNFTLTDNSGGAVTFSDDARFDVNQVATANSPILLQSTTIATLASQTSFTLTAGSADNDAYNGAIAIITDTSTSTQKAVGTVSDYVGSTRTITLDSDPGVFTMAVSDTIDLIAPLGSSGGGGFSCSSYFGCTYPTSPTVNTLGEGVQVAPRRD